MFMAACTSAVNTVDTQPEQSEPSSIVTETTSGSDMSSVTEEANPANDSDAWRVRVIGPTDEEVWSFTETELGYTLQNMDSIYPSELFAHVYSTINNWPSARFYVAEGYSVAAILEAAGLYEIAQTITFRGSDGYEMSLTRDQLLDSRYFFPNVGENEDDAEPVIPIIAYRWREGTDDLNSMRDENPSLIIGQSNPFEHTNPVFVFDISYIIVSDMPPEAWPAASTFPQPGVIHTGETVNLQHPNFGQVKLHYTLDGSEPNMLSPMFNPSTFQLELNAPIPITEPTTIKVIVYGFGRSESEVAVFEFMPED